MQEYLEEKELEEEEIPDKTIQRLIRYLKNEKWSAEQILNLLDYVTKDEA